MAKKTMLEQARKAYNKSASTKYRVQANGKRTKKKKEKVKSHYGNIQKKTQNTEENRREARNQTKNVAAKVGSNVVKKKTTESKPTTTGTNKQNGRRSGAITSVSSKSAERRTGAATARTTAKNVGNAVKTSTNLHKTPLKVTDVTQGTAKGTAAGTAYNKSKAADKALQKAGEKKTLTVSREQLTAEQKAAQERAARQTRFYTNSLVAAGRMTQKQADDAVEKARKNAKRGVKQDHTLTYSNSAQSNETVQRVANASKFANTEVEDKKAAEKAMREARFYANSQVAAGKMTQKEADRLVKQAGKGHRTTQSANILDKLGGEGEAERQGTRQAGQMNDSKFASGVMQGLSYADNTRAVGKYNKQAAELVDTVKQSGAFNTGYMVGQAGQFMLGGTGKMTDALVKGVAKSGAARSALNIGLRKAGADALFESPINALDAVKMSTDANGNFDKNAFVKYMALNTGLSGGMGGVIGGVGSKLAKNDAKAYITLSAKANSGAGLTEQEKVRLVNLQKKMDSIRNGNDVANTDIVNKADYDAEVSKKVFEKGGTVDDAIKVVNGGGTHTEKIGYANSIKETANAEFERLRVAREQMLEQARNTTPEEAKLLRAQASKLSSEINRLGEISNTAEKQLAIELKRNKKAVTELTQNVKAMSEATGVNYRVVNDKDMKKLISEAGGDVSDDYFYKGFYYKNKNGETEILINSDSPQAHQTVIGHETGHLIKSANEKEFDDLGNMLEEYARKNDDFDAVYNQLKRSYPDATEAELREEVTCELLGRYVYGADDKFIKQLAGEKPSVVQRIVEYLKRLFDNTSDKEMAKELQAIIDKTSALVKNIDKNADAKAINADYMKAAKAGDEKTAQKYVDDLAEKKFADSAVRGDDGKLIKMYHGSVDDFTTFDKNKIRAADYDAPFNGFWFSSDKLTSPAFKDAKYTKAFYLDIKNPAPHSVYRKVAKEVRETYWTKDLPERSRSFDDEVRYQLQDMGYDGVHYDGAYKFTDANVKEYNEKGITTFEGANGKLYDLAKDDDRGGYARLYPHNSRNEIINYDDAEDFLAEQQMGNPYRNNDVWVAFEPTQIKSADAITRDGDRIIPLNERFDKSVDDSKFSRENIGYHAGDLGKAEPRARMSGDRGTGHYGTGTYFVGNKAKISDDYYGKRPVETVDFTKYKMWKPLLKSDASELHDFLKKVNRYWSVIDSPLNSFDAVWNFRKRGNKIYDDFWNVKYDIRNGDTWDTDISIPQKTLNEYGEQYKKLFDETGAEHIFKKVVGKDFDGNYTEEIIDSLAEQFERSDYRESDWIKFADDMKRNTDPESFGMLKQADFLFRDNPNGINVTPQKLKGLLEEVKKDMEADTLPHDVQDSASTRLMKKLGYEGVDVRGTDMDNTYGGSVIYDLKGEDLARKKEIGTARFSKESKPPKGSSFNGRITAETITDSSGKVTKEADDAYMKAAESGDIETAQKFADTLAKEKGYVVNAHRGGIQTAYDKEHGYYIGTMFSSDKNIASAFAYGNKENLGSYYLKMDKPLVIDAEGHSYVDVPVRDTHPDKELVEYAQDDIDYIGGERDYGSISVDDIGKWADEHGYDSVEIRNVKEGVGGEPATDYIVINPEQIKSADAITKDDNGNIIPLSERFDIGNNDIRFSKESKPKSEAADEAVKIEDLEARLKIVNNKLKTTGNRNRRAALTAEQAELKKYIKREKAKTETQTKSPTETNPKPEKTETQKLSDNNNASAELKQALVDIDKAGVYKDDAEKVSKRFNDLESKIKKEVAHLENAKKSDKYATEAERAERVAEIEDELKTLRNQQAKAAGKIEQMGKMKAVDDSIDPQDQFHQLRGETSRTNKELQNADNLKNEDNWIKDKWNSVRRLWEDSLIEVENVAKRSDDKKLREEILTAANRVRNSQNVANFWITKGRSTFDNKVSGKSLDEIFPKELLGNEAKYKDFQEYLIMKHVPARHEKGTDIYPEVSPELADKIVNKLEGKYGEELTDWADDVYRYLKDLQQYRVDSGMLSQKAADQFAKDYPFYVPTNRVNEDEAIDFFTGGLSNQIRTAKGGENDVLDMYSQLYTATNKTIHAAEENEMLNLYFRAKGVTPEQIKGAELPDLEHAVIEANVNKKTGSATVSFFIDGKPVKFPCSHQLALGLRELDGLEFERLMNAAKVSTLYGKPFKALITDWNLVFGVRNGMRDMQQAVVNSKDTRYFGSSFGAAGHAIAHEDSPYRKLYASMGGERAQLVSYDAVAKNLGIEKQGKVDALHEKVQDWVDADIKGKHINPVHYIEGINGAIEMMPRMCEFIGTLRKEANSVLKKQGSSLKKLRKEIIDEVNALEKEGKIGQSEIPAEVENRLANRIIEMVDKDTIDSAMRNANDITLNFGRSGVLGKALNMGFVPYLNPSIQGLSKLVRLFTEAGGEGGWKALASLGMKIGVFNVSFAALNEIALRDNEAYQNLNTRDKDNNFFIPLDMFGEAWEDKFFKFPKPRENAVLIEPVEYGLRYFFTDKVEYAYFDWDKLKMEDVPLWEKIPLTDEGKQSLRTAVDNIGVINPMTSNMVSPLWQTFHNKTWYGGSIESAYETSINEDTGKANVPVNERYDTGTSGVAIWLGQSKVAKELNLSPKKIDNILDSYTGMIYDLGISQTTEEAKTRGNYLLRTAASQFLKDSVFSNKLSTKAWEKIDGMSKKEQDEYKSKYMYDTYKYDDAMDAITADKDMTVKEKMDAKRQLQKQRNKLYRAAINGEPNETNPLKDISKYLGANKTLNKFLPKSGDEQYDNWTDYYKNYKKTKGYKGLTPAQKEKEAQKFLDVYTLGVKGQSKVSGDFHDSPSWGMTGVAAAQRYKQGKLSQKDAKTIMESCGVYESQTESYFKYADHGGNVSRYAVTKKNNNKAEDLAESMGVTTSGDGSIWKNKYSKEKGIKGGVLSMSLATGKADFKDRAYYISNSGDSNMLIKMNAARGYAEKYGHSTKQLIKLGKKADADGNTYLSNEEIESACQTIKKGKATSEEKAMAWVLLGGNPNKNPFGAIGDYSHDGDTGITMDEEEKSGGRGGHGWGRRRHRGGGGGGSSKGTMPKTASGAIKGTVSDPFSGISRIGGRSGGSTSTNTRKSNLNDAYRKRVKKLRQNLS